MNKRGSIFILFLWALILMALFAMSVGFRARLATKIEGYEMRRFEMGYDFLSALNLARFLIESDNEPRVDFLEDDWYGVPKTFGGMDFAKRFDLKITDEESKIDLNKATEPFLLRFFEVLKEHGVELKTDLKDMAGSILAWRGQIGIGGAPTLGFKNKRAPFETVEELRLIQHISPKDAKILRPFVTVYSSGASPQMQVNLNTVDPYILEALILSLAGGELAKRELIETIMKFRAEKQVFQQEDLRLEEFIEKLRLSHSPTVTILANQFLSFVTVDSQFFSVHVRPRLPKKSSFALEAVLGPRAVQPVLTAPRGGSPARPSGEVVSLPLEILSWREGLS